MASIMMFKRTCAEKSDWIPEKALKGNFQSWNYFEELRVHGPVHSPVHSPVQSRVQVL